MNKLVNLTIIIIILLTQVDASFSQTNMSSSQSVGTDEYSWSTNTNLRKSVFIETEKRNGRIVLYIVNKTFYPLTVNIDMDVKNLIPSIALPCVVVVHSGKNRILTLEAKGTSMGFSYNYNTSYKYRIGTENSTHNDDISYILPFGKGKTISTINVFKNIHSSVFKATIGDTIYAARKGYVCSTPYNTKEREGKYRHPSITNRNVEIYQPDGTIAFYNGIDPDDIFVERGQKVYPGDPIGIASNSIIRFAVFRFTKDEGLKKIDVSFCYKDNNKSYLTGNKKYTVSYPEDIIFKEMKRREIKKYCKRHGLKYKRKKR